MACLLTTFMELRNKMVTDISYNYWDLVFRLLGYKDSNRNLNSVRKYYNHKYGYTVRLHPGNSNLRDCFVMRLHGNK